MDYKQLLNQVQKTVSALDMSRDDPESIARVAETIAKNFHHEFGITGGRLYELRNSDYELTQRFGRSKRGRTGIFVSADYGPIRELLDAGVIVMEPDDPGVDRALEKRVGAKRFAAIAVGERHYLLSFNVAPESSREDILFSLNIIRQALEQKLRTDRFETLIEEARQIQQSILPARPPDFDGFEIYGKTIPAAGVSGDYYDYIPISENVLGLAVADATGHGLPAALVVRDVHMGLRMGSDRDFKIIRTLQKLNGIIHRARLSTKFVSLFYGELESSGTFIYTNAGHNPPFLIQGRRTEWLRYGGAVLGPTPHADYTRGYVHIHAGDVLCLYSDGVVEAVDRREQEFGARRLVRLVRENRERSAREICEIVLERVMRWGPGEQDDRTVVVVRALHPKTLPPLPH